MFKSEEEHYMHNDKLHLFQQTINNYNPDIIFKLFIELAEEALGIDDIQLFYDFDNMFILETNAFGTYSHHTFKAGMDIRDLWLKITCFYRRDPIDGQPHRGVDCKLTDFFLGIGCPDCYRLLNEAYPLEEDPINIYSDHFDIPY